MAEAAKGTVQGGDLVYNLDGETYRTPIKTIRGDYPSTAPPATSYAAGRCTTSSRGQTISFRNGYTASSG